MAAADYIQVAQELYISYFGRPADYYGLADMTANLNAAGAPTSIGSIASAYNTNATVKAIMDNFGTSAESEALYGNSATSNATFINAVYTQVLGRSADLAGLNFWVNALKNNEMTRASAAVQIMAAATKADADPTDKATATNKIIVATNFTNGIDTAEEVIGYAGDAAALVARNMLAGVTSTTDTAAYQTVVDSTLNSIAHPVVPGVSFALTSAADLFVGGSANDTFNAGLSNSVATFDALDSLNGGAGTDTLNATLGGATVQPASMTNIENIVLNGAGGTLSLLGSTGVTSLTAQGTTALTTFSNIGATSVALKVANTSASTTFAHVASVVAGTADSATLTLQNVAGGTQTVGGIETLNIVSSGSANTTTLATTAATKYVVTGDQDLTLGAVGASVVTVDASALTGALSLSTGGAASTITGGAGNDAITLTAAVADSITTGAGNDTVVTGGFLTTADTLAGGAGTDILTGTSADLTGSTFTKISGFETLTVTDALGAALTTANVNTGVNTVNLAAGSGTFTLTMEAGAKAVNLAAANTGVLTVADTGTATTDTLTIKNTAAATNVFAAQNLVDTGFETLTLDGSGTGAATIQTIAALTVTADTGGTSTVKFTGSNQFTVSGALTANVIDATGLTGTAFLNMTGSSASVTSILGGAGNDVLLGDAAGYIDGAAGNDNITGGTGIDTIIGGAGNDTISGAGGNDIITGGDGNDQITEGVAGTASVDAGAGDDIVTFSGTVDSTDTLNGGAGTDTLVINSTDVTTVNGLGFAAGVAFNSHVTNFENLSIAALLTSGTATNILDVSRFNNISKVTLTGDNGAISTKVQGLIANSTFDIQAAQTAGANITLALADATGTSDVINVAANTSATADFKTITTTGIETVNITSNDTDTTADATVTANAAHTITLVDATATTVTVAGNSASLNLVLTGDTAITSLSAASYAGALTATLVGTGAASLTGGAGADVLTGGSGSDVITGGAGADTIVGGLGSDTLDGGTGANQLDASGMVGVTDDGVVTSTGAVINLGATSVSAATVNTALSLVAGKFISGATAAVAAGHASYLFGSNAANAGAASDTISNFTKIVGTTGSDYIVGNAAGSQTITGGTGADYMKGGTGADTFVMSTNTSIARTAQSFAGAAIAAADTITFGNGLDIISGFTAGTDKLDVGTAGAAVTGIGADFTALAAATTYILSGAFNTTTGVFTIAADGAGADTLVVDATGGGANAAVATATTFAVLVGVTSTDLVAGSFI